MMLLTPPNASCIGFSAIRVTMVVQFVIGMLRGRNRGVVRNVAANAAERAWTVATYLMLPIIILEDISFIDSTGRATRLHGSNVMQIVVGELGLLITTRIFSGLMTVIAIAIVQLWIVNLNELFGISAKLIVWQVRAPFIA